MFQVKDGVIKLNKTRTLSPKQLNTLSRITGEAEKNRYLLSIMGLVKSRVFIDRIKSRGDNCLARKQKGSILLEMKRLQNLEDDHTPNNKHLGEWIGVEIECIIPHQDGDDNNRDCVCEFDDDGEQTYQCNNCEDGGGKHWSMYQAHKWLRGELTKAGVTRVCVKQDGSLSDDEGHGVECTILFNASHGFEPLQKLCSALLKAGCYVNKTCGLHVHLDARHLKPKQVKLIGSSIGNALPVLKWLVPESRHDNHYCRLGVSGFRGERYYAVNLTAFKKYRTIEIRLHSGSISFEKITNWINLLKLVGASHLKTSVNTFQELIDLNGMSEILVEYMERRITELNPDAWSKLMPVEVVAPTPVIDTSLDGQMLEQFETLITDIITTNQQRVG